MYTLINNSDLHNLYEKGFVIKKNIINLDTINKLKSIILQNTEGKGNPDTHFAINLRYFLIKILKMDFKKVSSSLFLLKLKNKLQLDNVASIIFKKPAILSMVDGYYNKKTSLEILPWHSDQSYSGAIDVKKINSPDVFAYKFFIYLTEVGPGNGCTSYIPGSHIVTYAVRNCIYNREIDYQPFWTIDQLLKIINYKNNFDKILNKISKKDLFFSFLKNAKECINDNNIDLFDFKALPGDMIIFNETGVHRGSKPVLQDRIVLRYLYYKIN